MDTQWSERNYLLDYQYSKDAERTLSFYLNEHEDILSKDEYALMDSGKLKEPTAGQRKALSTLITNA